MNRLKLRIRRFSHQEFLYDALPCATFLSGLRHGFLFELEVIVDGVLHPETGHEIFAAVDVTPPVFAARLLRAIRGYTPNTTQAYPGAHD